MTAQTPDAGDATRARDADRNLAIALVDAAFSDGQLTSTEREERCDRVLAAETLGELRRLTRDLQAPVVVAAPRRTRRRLVPIVAATVVVAAIVVGVVISGDDPEPEPQPQEVQSAAPQSSAPTRQPDPPKDKPKLLRYSFDPRGVKNFIPLYRKEFGTTKGTAFGFSADQVVIARRGDTGEIEQWGYVDGHFVDDGYYDNRRFPPGQVDLAELNVNAVFRKLHQVKDRVGIENPRYYGISVIIERGERGAAVAAGNSGNCQLDWLTLDGDVRSQGESCPTGD